MDNHDEQLFRSVPNGNTDKYPHAVIPEGNLRSEKQQITYLMSISTITQTNVCFLTTDVTCVNLIETHIVTNV
jgi:hypothetical protein